MAYQPLWVILYQSQPCRKYYFISRWKDKEVNNFAKGINPKVNVIVRLEFELAYYDVTVQHISQYAMGTPSFREGRWLLFC